MLYIFVSFNRKGRALQRNKIKQSTRGFERYQWEKGIIERRKGNDCEGDDSSIVLFSFVCLFSFLYKLFFCVPTQFLNHPLFCQISDLGVAYISHDCSDFANQRVLKNDITAIPLRMCNKCPYNRQERQP